jgi:hypothetical protein
MRPGSHPEARGSVCICIGFRAALVQSVRCMERQVAPANRFLTVAARKNQSPPSASHDREGVVSGAVIASDLRATRESNIMRRLLTPSHQFRPVVPNYATLTSPTEPVRAGFRHVYSHKRDAACCQRSITQMLRLTGPLASKWLLLQRLRKWATNCHYLIPVPNRSRKLAVGPIRETV